MAEIADMLSRGRRPPQLVLTASGPLRQFRRRRGPPIRGRCSAIRTRGRCARRFQTRSAPVSVPIISRPPRRPSASWCQEQPLVLTRPQVSAHFPSLGAGVGGGHRQRIQATAVTFGGRDQARPGAAGAASHQVFDQRVAVERQRLLARESEPSRIAHGGESVAPVVVDLGKRRRPFLLRQAVHEPRSGRGREALPSRCHSGRPPVSCSYAFSWSSSSNVLTYFIVQR